MKRAEAKAELVSHMKVLRAFALSLARDPAVAGDLVQETVLRAADSGACPDQVGSLLGFYRRVRGGLGFRKTPREFGAVPFEPYSHTPGDGGARQPGMTGQVKEDLLARLGEVGVRVRGGRSTFDPTLLDPNELRADARSVAFTPSARLSAAVSRVASARSASVSASSARSTSRSAARAGAWPPRGPSPPRLGLESPRGLARRCGRDLWMWGSC